MIDVSTPEGQRALLEAWCAAQPARDRALLRIRMMKAQIRALRPGAERGDHLIAADALSDGTWAVYPSVRYRERVRRLPIRAVVRTVGRAPRHSVRVIRVNRDDVDDGGDGDPEPEPPGVTPDHGGAL